MAWCELKIVEKKKGTAPNEKTVRVPECVGEGCPKIYEQQGAAARKVVEPKCRVVTEGEFVGGKFKPKNEEGPKCLCVIDECEVTPKKDADGTVTKMDCAAHCGKTFYKKDSGRDEVKTSCILVMDHSDDNNVKCVCIML